MRPVILLPASDDRAHMSVAEAQEIAALLRDVLSLDPEEKAQIRTLVALVRAQHDLKDEIAGRA